MKATLERRIIRLNAEFAVAAQRGLDAAPFIRRAKNLTEAWRALA